MNGVRCLNENSLFKLYFGNMIKSDINKGNCKIDCGGGAITILFIIFIGVFK